MNARRVTSGRTLSGATLIGHTVSNTTHSVSEKRQEAHAAYRAAELAYEAGKHDPHDPDYLAAMERVNASLDALGLER